jgi:glycine cleavage system H protein
MYPENLRYTKQHEWIDVQEGHTARVGITDYAQHELGDIVFVELPNVDDDCEQGEAFGVVESVKAVSDVYMPVGGKVKEVNVELENQPELINQSPHEEGWLISIEMSDEEELSGLMSAEEYAEFVGDLSEKEGDKKKAKKAKKGNVRSTVDEADDDEEDDELEGYTEEEEEAHDSDEEAHYRGQSSSGRHEEDEF